jgi:hypothetical protein
MDSRGRTRGGPLALTHELGRLGSSALGCYRSHSARSARSARSASALGDAPMSRPTPDDRISPSARYVTGSSAFPKADADRAGALRTLADVADGLRVSSLRSHRASSGIFVFFVRVLVSWGGRLRPVSTTVPASRSRNSENPRRTNNDSSLHRFRSRRHPFPASGVRLRDLRDQRDQRRLLDDTPTEAWSRSSAFPKGRRRSHRARCALADVADELRTSRLCSE